MSKINFVKFKNAIQLEDYLALRDVLQEDVEIVFADDFYSAEFFKFLQNVCGGGGILVAFNTDLADLEIETLKKVILAKENSYIAFCNPYEKFRDSIFFKLVNLDSFSRYATEYAYKNHILEKHLRNILHSKWNNTYKTQFFEDRRLYNLATQWNVVKDFSFEFPREIWIGLLNSCNINCSFCSWFSYSSSKTLCNDYFKTDKRIATIQVENILQYAGRAKAKCIFSGPGEPLLDMRLTDFVKCAKEYGVSSVEIATNGVLLTPKKFLELVKAGVDSLRIGICFTKETYDKCAKGFFENFKHNLIEIAKQIESLKLFIAIRLDIIYEGHRIVEMLEFWNCLQGVCKRIRVGFTCCLESNSGEFLDNVKLSKVRTMQQRHTCSAPFASLYVFPSGDVGCCSAQRNSYLGKEDIEKFCLGNVYKQDLGEIWNGTFHKRFCLAHKNMEFVENEALFCQSCGAWWNECEH